MSGKKKNRADLTDLTPSAEGLARLDQDIAQLDMQRVFLVGVRDAMAKALGLEGATAKTADKQQERSSKDTVGWLLGVYRSDPRSPYLQLPQKTRSHYDVFLKRLDQTASRNLSDLKQPDIQQLYEEWTSAAAASGRGAGRATAKATIAIFRAAVNFAATTLENSECFRLSVLLRDMDFADAEKRKVIPLTEDDVKKIMAKAKEMGFPSIALAQAIQFECKIKQRDVIGEWVPPAELREPSGVINGAQAWHRGIRWNNISAEWNLTHKTGNAGKIVRLNLRNKPLVFEEISRNPHFGSSNPLILKEGSTLPWIAWDFRRVWREIARAAGISDGKFNTDVQSRSRARQAG
jgi:hypothetical protein